MLFSHLPEYTLLTAFNQAAIYLEVIMKNSLAPFGHLSKRVHRL